MDFVVSVLQSVPSSMLYNIFYLFFFVFVTKPSHNIFIFVELISFFSIQKQIKIFSRLKI